MSVQSGCSKKMSLSMGLSSIGEGTILALLGHFNELRGISATFEHDRAQQARRYCSFQRIVSKRRFVYEAFRLDEQRQNQEGHLVNLLPIPEGVSIPAVAAVGPGTLAVRALKNCYVTCRCDHLCGVLCGAWRWE